MRKLIIIVLTLIFAMSLFFIGIGCKAEEVAIESVAEVTSVAGVTVDEKPYKGVTLKCISTNDPPYYALQAVLPEFEEKTGIKVEMELLSVEEEMSKTRLEASKGSDGYDIWVIPTYDNVVYVANGWVENLDEMEKKTGLSINRETFVPGILEKAGLDMNTGVLYGVPIMLCYASPMEYRKDMLEDPEEQANFKEKYNYDLRPPKTWDEFRDVAEFFTRDTNNDGETDFWGCSLALDPQGALVTTWLPLYDTSEGLEEGEPFYVRLLTKDLQPLFNGPAGVRAIEFIKDLYDNGFIAPGSLTTGWSNCSEAIMGKKAFMTYMWAETLEPAFNPKISEVADLIWWADQPIWEVPRMQTGGWMMFINQNSKNKEAAWEFIVWATSAESEKMQIETGLGSKMPLRIENFENPELGQPWYEIPKNMMTNYEKLPELYLPETDIVMQTLNTALQKIIVGDIAAQEGLDEAAAKVVKDLTEAGAYDRISK